MVFFEKLEVVGVKVDVVIIVSVLLDVFVLFEGFFGFLCFNDVVWFNSIVILLVFVFENYYGVFGLVCLVFIDVVYLVVKNVYDWQFFNVVDILIDLYKLMWLEYFDLQYFVWFVYGCLIVIIQVYCWVICFDVCNYYGEMDEVIIFGVGCMVMIYVQVMGVGNMWVEVVFIGLIIYCGMFVIVVFVWKCWFDEKVVGQQCIV